MRIPTSMIVMGVLTAIPFGLAIRQTMHKDPAADRDLEEAMDPSLRREREYEQQNREYEARLEAERVEEQARKRRMRLHQKQVFGPTPASLGPLFDGVKLGAPRDTFESEDAHVRIAAAIEDQIDVGFGLDLLDSVGVRVQIGSYDHECSDFEEDLKSAWGPSLFGVADFHTWVANGQRASFDRRSCTLTIERFSDVAKWLGHGDTLVPLDAVGKPAKTLMAKLGKTVDPDETLVTWEAAGVGSGSGLTELTAEITDGKISAITARTEVDPATRSDIEERLTKLFGAPKEYPESGADLGWNGRPPVGLTAHDRSLELRIGK